MSIGLESGPISNGMRWNGPAFFDARSAPRFNPTARLDTSQVTDRRGERGNNLAALISFMEQGIGQQRTPPFNAGPYQPPAGYQPIGPSFLQPNNAGMYKPPAGYQPIGPSFRPPSSRPIDGSQGLQSVFAEYVKRQQQRQQGMSPYSPQGQGQGQGIAAMLQKILQLQSGTPQPFNVTPW